MRGKVSTVVVYMALLCTVWLANLCVNAEKTTKIQGQVLIPDTASVPPLKIVLRDNKDRVAYTTNEGKFEFDFVPSGKYLLSVVSPTYAFSHFHVIVDGKSGSKRIVQYPYYGAPGTELADANAALKINALSRPNYFAKRETITIGTMLKNPMVLMMAFTAVMAFGMPKLMEGIDPEELKQVQQDMGGGDPQQMMSNLFGGSKNDDDDD